MDGGATNYISGGTAKGQVNVLNYSQAQWGGATTPIEAVTVNMITGTTTYGNGDIDHFGDIQQVIGSPHNDTLIATQTASNTYLNGGGGSDTFEFINSNTSFVDTVTIQEFSSSTDTLLFSGWGTQAQGSKLYST